MLAYCLASLFTLGLLCVSAPSEAHELRPAVLGIQELAPGKFGVHWAAPRFTDPGAAHVRPVFPAHCAPWGDSPPRELAEDWVIDCGERGLLGELSFVPLEQPLGRVSVHIAWLDGSRSLQSVSGEPPSLRLFGGPTGEGLSQHVAIATDYCILGVEHILAGPDHLLFVIGLLLFVRTPRRLLATITAFTLAHSLTLAAATLGHVSLPSGPVEFTIALSILLLAVEATRKESSWTERAPWAIAFGFGLLHGFGFASALGDVGLPAHRAALALFAFNVGVELGQLLVVAGIALTLRVLRPSPATAQRVQFGVVIALGSAAMFWTLERGAALLADWS